MILISVLLRTALIALNERATERGKGVEARHRRHNLKRVVGVAKQLHGVAHTVGIDILIKREVATLVEKLAQVCAVGAEKGCKFGQSQLGVEKDLLVLETLVKTRAHVSYRCLVECWLLLLHHNGCLWLLLRRLR